MAFQRAVKTGGKKELTPEQIINRHLEAGINVFILRWKKSSEFESSVFGYEVLTFVPYHDNRLNETSYRPLIEKGELFFWPDEMNIPVAYAADTPRNRSIMAIGFYTNPYTINGLITPNANVPTVQIQAEIEAMAKKLGVVKPFRDGRAMGVYGNAIGGETSKVATPAAPAASDKPRLPSAEACLEAATTLVHERFAPFVEKMKEEHKNQWRNTKVYKDTFEPAIQQEYLRLLQENGFQLPAPPQA